MRELTIPVVLRNGDDLVLAQEHWLEYADDAITPEFGHSQALSVGDSSSADGHTWVLIAGPPTDIFETTDLTEDDYVEWKTEREATRAAELEAANADREVEAIALAQSQSEAAERARVVLADLNLDPDDLRALLMGAF